MLGAVRANGADELTITTNGSMWSAEHVTAINSLSFDRVMISVSVDSLDPADHDRFRHHPGAFDKARRAIDLILAQRSDAVLLSIRMTLRPHQIPDMAAMVDFAFRLGADRVSMSGIYPSGRAMHDRSLLMSSRDKRQFIQTIFELRKSYPPTFGIDTNDPLKCLVRVYSDIGDPGELVFDGCPAAAVTFNVNANGDMTPCSLLHIPIMNVFGMSVDEMVEAYRTSHIVKDMLDMNLGGKCGACTLKYQCGGCRARAFAKRGDFLAEDPDCWL